MICVRRCRSTMGIRAAGVAVSFYAFVGRYHHLCIIHFGSSACASSDKVVVFSSAKKGSYNCSTVEHRQAMLQGSGNAQYPTFAKNNTK